MIQIKILIAGKYGFMMNQLIMRLNREKCDVYTIAGKDSRQKSLKLPSHINFDFDADSSSVNYIMQCVKPDTVIFMGAKEDSYDWNDSMTSSRYMAELTNILTWSKEHRVGRFVYLSDMSLYNENYGNPEGMEESDNSEKEPSGMRLDARTFYNGECLCRVFNDEIMSTVVLRLPVIYGPLQLESENLNRIGRMSYDALKYSSTNAYTYEKYMTIYVSDAVDAIFKVSTAEKCSKFMYYVKGSRIVTDREVLNIVDSIAGTHTAINGAGIQEREISVDQLTGDFEKEFLYSPHIDLKTGVERTVRYVKKNYKTLLHKEEQKIEEAKKEEKEIIKSSLKSLLYVLRKLLENIVLFAAVFFLAYKLKSVSLLKDIDFLFLYVLVISINFGVGQSVFASVLATMGYIRLDMTESNIGFVAAVSDYGIIIRFLFYFICAILISYTILRKKAELIEKEEAYKDISEEYSLVYRLNNTNMELKKVFEERLLNYGDSIGKIYNIVSELEVLDPEKIVLSSLGVVERIMNVKDVCIYKLGRENYYHQVGASTEESKIMKRSIKLDDYEEMSQVLINGDVFVNHKVKNELPRMAAPIFFEEKLVYVIMLWNMDFEQLNLYKKNLFIVLTKLITSSLKKGYQYEEAERKLNYYDNTDILVPKAFLRKLSEKLGNDSLEKTEYTLLQMNMEGMGMEEASNRLITLLRDGDRIGKMDEQDTQLYLLVHANSEEVVYVLKRLDSNGIKCRVV